MFSTVDVLGQKVDVLVADVLEVDVLEVDQMGRPAKIHTTEVFVWVFQG
jgi:hypothetical protein